MVENRMNRINNIYKNKNKNFYQPIKTESLIDYLVRHHQAKLIIHSIFRTVTNKRFNLGSNRINGSNHNINQTKADIEIYVLTFQDQDPATIQQTTALVKGQFANRVKRQIKTLEFDFNSLHYVILYNTLSQYPYFFAIHDDYEIGCWLNTQCHNGVISFSPQIYADALMAFNQTDHWPALKKLTETYFNRYINSLIIANAENINENALVNKDLGQQIAFENIFIKEKQENTRFSNHETKILLDMSLVNPISCLPKAKLNPLQIPNDLRQAITEQINQ